MNNLILDELAGERDYDLSMVEKRYDETIGGRIHWARKNKGLTLKEIGAALGVRTSHLSGVENNKVGLSLPVFAALVDMLDVSADWVLGKPEAALHDERDSDDVRGWSPTVDDLARVADTLPTWRQRELLAAAQFMTTADEELAADAQIMAEELQAQLAAAELVIGDAAVRAIKSAVITYLTGHAPRTNSTVVGGAGGGSSDSRGGGDRDSSSGNLGGRQTKRAGENVRLRNSAG